MCQLNVCWYVAFHTFLWVFIWILCRKVIINFEIFSDKNSQAYFNFNPEVFSTQCGDSYAVEDNKVIGNSEVEVTNTSEKVGQMHTSAGPSWMVRLA